MEKLYCSSCANYDNEDNGCYRIRRLSDIFGYVRLDADEQRYGYPCVDDNAPEHYKDICGLEAKYFVKKPQPKDLLEIVEKIVEKGSAS